jgi:hypothetical protein
LKTTAAAAASEAVYVGMACRNMSYCLYVLHVTNVAHVGFV